MSQDDNGARGANVRVPRRALLKTLAASSLVFEPACSGGASDEDPSVRAHAVAAAHEVESPIKIENRLQGTSDYLLTKPALAGEVEGYAADTSVEAGDTLRVFVSVTRAQSVRCEVYRIGYYQGLGARLVGTVASTFVIPQPAPIIDPTTGLVECQWQSAFAIPIEAGFVNGYYLCKLTNTDGFESYVPFIVRESGRLAPFLVQASVTTWQAYNRWGGASLYFNQLPASVGFTPSRAYQVSFDRPYAPDADIGSVEYSFVRFLEERGYDIAYVTNVDLDRSPELLNNRRLFATSGHDEYWSLTERNAVQNARDAGLSLAFFSGNTAYRRIRLENSSTGVSRRTITCYKSGSLDPVGDALDTTADTEETPNARPENEILGVLWAGWAHMQGFPLVVADPEHWIYEGTGVEAHDSVGHIVGYEWDVVSDNAVSPAGLEIVADSPALHEYGYNSRATATVYYPTLNSFVFAAGTISWGDGLGTPGLIDQRLQRVTENIVARAGLFPEAQLVVAPRTNSDVGTSAISSVVAGTGNRGSADGPALAAEFDAPAGIAAGRNGELYVCDSGNHLIRKISANGQVSTVAGGKGKGQGPRLSTPTGIAVAADGGVFFSDTNLHQILHFSGEGPAKVYAGSTEGSGDSPHLRQARFAFPRGICLDSSGALYVADSRNDAIRRIDESGVTTVVSTAGGPTAVAVAPDGTIYYLASWYGSIVRVTPDGTRTMLANPSQVFGDQSGPGATAALRPADGLCLTQLGLVFSDTGNNRVRGLLFDAQNTVWTLLGTGNAGTGVGTGATTQVSLPRGLTAVNGGFAIADSANHRILWFGV